MTATETDTAAPQTLEFKTELKQLLDLIIHSLYTKKEIFLRELVSNAADAIDKVRFQALTDPAVAEGNTDYKIKLVADQAAGTLTVSDNGIGMSRETVVDNLGTIAKSGTRAFMENLKATQAQDRPELIGQFGVGFYASFMAADKVTVVSRMAGGDRRQVGVGRPGQLHGRAGRAGHPRGRRHAAPAGRRQGVSGQLPAAGGRPAVQQLHRPPGRDRRRAGEGRRQDGRGGHP